MQLNPISNNNFYSAQPIKNKGCQNKSFASMLVNSSSSTNIESMQDKDHITVHWNGEEMAAVCFPNGANFALYYTEESSKENPIVLAKVVDEAGIQTEFEIRINDINPSNASFLEMEALLMHNPETFSTQDHSLLNAVTDTSNFNMVEKKDYVTVFAGEKEKAQCSGLIDISKELSDLIVKLKNYYMQQNEAISLFF